LLSGNYRDGAFEGELCESRGIAILLAEGGDEGGAALGREMHFAGD
jgi:hypothetical protein